MRRETFVLLGILAGFAPTRVGAAESARLQVGARVIRPVSLDLDAIARRAPAAGVLAAGQGETVVSASGAAAPVTVRFEGRAPAEEGGTRRVTILLDGDPPPPSR